MSVELGVLCTGLIMISVGVLMMIIIDAKDK